MEKKNYYLSLLQKKAKELKKAMKECDEKGYSEEYKNHLIAGYIIILDSILETGIGNLHTSKFDKLSSLIYFTRQKAVHYGYFDSLDYTNEQTANKIIDAIEKHIDKEQEFYRKIFSKSFDEKNNIVIKDSSRAYQESRLYKFKSKDGKSILSIPFKEVFTLTQKTKKIENYIINTDITGALYSYENGSITNYKEISGGEIIKFFKKNFIIESENFNDHNVIIESIIDAFVNDPINSVQVAEFCSSGTTCTNTIDVIKDFIIENSMYKNFIYNNHMEPERTSLKGIQKADYIKLQQSTKKSIVQQMDQKDAFFVEMTIKRAKFYFDFLREDSPMVTNPKVLSTILIQLFEAGPKHFSLSFVSSSLEFKKCYNNLLRYRNIFSHNVLSNDQYDSLVEQFRNETLSFIKILQSINLNSVTKKVPETLNPYIVIEKNKSKFFNYKHEQFLETEDNIYIGKKIHYSSKDISKDELIAIIQGGNNISSTLYYTRDEYGYLNPKYRIDEKGNKKFLSGSSHPIKGGKEVKIDFNLSQLFAAYFELRKENNKGEIEIAFLPSKHNNLSSHKDDLETVIMRFFVHGYLPVELLQKTKLDISRIHKGVIALTDEKNNVIADIYNTKLLDCYSEIKKDEKTMFSRIDDIKHDFSKRRHKRWLIKKFYYLYLKIII